MKGLRGGDMTITAPAIPPFALLVSLSITSPSSAPFLKEGFMVTVVEKVVLPLPVLP